MENYSIQELQEKIERETGVKVEDQDILLASGASPDPNLGAHQCWTAPVSFSKITGILGNIKFWDLNFSYLIFIYIYTC